MFVLLEEVLTLVGFSCADRFILSFSNCVGRLIPEGHRWAELPVLTPTSRMTLAIGLRKGDVELQPVCLRMLGNRQTTMRAELILAERM